MKSSLLWCTAMMAAALPAWAQVAATGQGTVATGPAVASQLGDANARVIWDSHGRVHRAYGELGVLAPGEAGVQAFLRDRLAPLGLRADEKFKVLMDERDAHGLRHVKVQRTLFGLEVVFDQVRLHAKPNGMVYALEAEVSDLSSLRYQAPALLPAKVVEIARNGYTGKLREPARSKLVIFGDVLPSTSGVHLAFRTRIAYDRTGGKVPVVEDVYVDAQTGVRLRRLSQVFTDGTPATMSSTDLNGASVTVNVAQYSDGVALKDLTTIPNGTIYTLDGSNSNNLYTTTSTSTPFSDQEAVSVAENVSGAIAFFNTTFGWTQWDFNSSPSGPGGTLFGIAHVGQQLNNAYFTTASSNGQTVGTMNFGDGDGQEFTPLAKATDVTGHELGHGIVAGTAQLVYENQSGALNEHYADTFGWEFNNNGNSGSSIDTIGATVVGPALQPALRNMCDPNQGQQMGSPIWQPADMSQYQQLPDDDNDDHGGVHTNSGIPNHAACLFRNAVTSNGGNGFDAVEKVWFQTLKNHLGASATFQDMVTDSNTSCGEVNLDSNTCAALNNAWVQVGLAAGASGGSCPANAMMQNGACVCNAGYQPNSGGTGCDMIPTPNCPANSHADSGQCYCDSGYTADTDGNCVLDNTSASCPANSTYQGGTCVCNPCFQPVAKNGDETNFSCDPISGCVVCGNDPNNPLQTEQNGACACESGTMADASGICQPVAGSCGNEDFAGRCIGNLLVFCDDTMNPEIISTIDCSTNPQANTCALDPAGGGYNCVAAVSNCGSVPATGACMGNTAQICEGGVLQSVDCGSDGCGAVDYSGTTYQYCLTAQGSGGTTGTSGGTTGTSGGPTGGTTGGATGGTAGGSTSGGTTGGTSGSTGSSDKGGSSGGCSSSGEASGLLALLGLALAQVRRRR
jgi:uncharacterized protein (TIGR03382 family)